MNRFFKVDLNGGLVDGLIGQTPEEKPIGASQEVELHPRRVFAPGEKKWSCCRWNMYSSMQKGLCNIASVIVGCVFCECD